MIREWNLRLVYLYLVCFTTLMMQIVGTVLLIQTLAEVAYPPPVYSPFYPKEYMQGLTAEELEKQRQLEEDRQKQRARFERARKLAGSLSLLVVAYPIYIYHWRRIRRESSGNEME